MIERVWIRLNGKCKINTAMAQIYYSKYTLRLRKVYHHAPMDDLQPNIKRVKLADIQCNLEEQFQHNMLPQQACRLVGEAFPESEKKRLGKTSWCTFVESN